MLCSSLTWRHSDRVFGFQGCPGLCPPVPPPSSDAQRAEEHPSSAGHAHHHQVKPLQGWDGAWLSNLTCAPSLQLGDMGQDRQWWASGYRSSAPWSCHNCSSFYLSPVQTRPQQPERGRGSLLPTAPRFCQHLPGRILVQSSQWLSLPSRNKETSRDEFIFYSKRLMRLLIEHALSLLPFQVGLGLHLGGWAPGTVFAL